MEYWLVVKIFETNCNITWLFWYAFTVNYCINNAVYISWEQNLFYIFLLASLLILHAYMRWNECTNNKSWPAESGVCWLSALTTGLTTHHVQGEVKTSFSDSDHLLILRSQKGFASCVCTLPQIVQKNPH